MHKAVMGLAVCGIVFYVVALLATLQISRRPVFETVVPKTGSAAMVHDKPAGMRINPEAAADMTVVDSGGAIIGQLAGVSQDSNGITRSILVETGGFLGLGSHVVRIPVGEFRIENGEVRVDLTARELEKLPEAGHAQ